MVVKRAKNTIFAVVKPLTIMRIRKTAIAGAVMLASAMSVHAQKVYSTNAEYNADVKVYVVDREYQADIVVFRTDKEYNADLKVYFTDKEYRAGWKNRSKRHLMY